MADIDHSRAAWNVVSALCNAIDSGEHSLGTVPALLKRVLADELWREFTPPGAAGPIQHKRFADFVTAEPTDGLGADVELIRKIVAGDTQAVDLLDRALQQPVGTNQHREGVDIINTQRPTGTSESAALRRLRKDRPDLHAQVLADELSAHAATVLAGFRPKTFTVRADKPESIVGTLRRQLDPQTLAAVISLLTAQSNQEGNHHQ